MRRRSTFAWILCSSTLGGFACLSPSDSEPSSGLEVTVSPLTLPGVVDACYSLTIRNDVNQTVSSRSDVCASQFGASGGITYVATCDATDSDNNGSASNTVTLTIDGLYAGAGKTSPITDFINPCAAPHAPQGCQLSANCVENADTPLTFNLTLMREANQGFFDIGINFDDIFCSAKLDCADPANAPLNLLHNPATGQRGQTAVIALACTSGPGGSPTDLLRDPLKIACDTQTTYLDPTFGRGNAYGTGSGQMTDPAPTDAIWQYAVYAGNETLTCSGQPCDKRYWNIAVGFDPTAKNCKLTTQATAIDAASTFTTPSDANYPVIKWDVTLTSNSTPATLACSKHPLNGSPTGVATTYTGVGTEQTFIGRFDGTNLDVGPCPTGWSGRTCSTPICSPVCGVHGACTAPNTCTCEPGWTGSDCTTTTGPVTVVTSDRIFALDAGDANSYPGSGTTWTNLASTNHATTFGSPTFNSLNYGALVFDGVDDYALSNSNFPSIGSNSITFDAWVSLSSNVSSGNLEVFSALGKGVSGNPSGWWIGVDSRNVANALGFAFVDTSSNSRTVYTPNFSFALNTWYHVAIIMDKATSSYRAYINGIEQALSTHATAGTGFPTAVLTPDQKLNIGAYDSLRVLAFNFFPGRIATTSVYSRALSLIEIRQNYDALKSRYFTTSAPAIASSSMTMNLDAAQVLSYPGLGTTWTNLANPSNATLVNGVAFSHLNAGRLDFDGTNDHATVPKTHSTFGANDFSVEMWLKSNGTLNDKYILSGRSSGVTSSLVLLTGGASGTTAGKLRVLTADGTSLASTALVANGLPHHVILTRTSGTLKVYIDGILDTTGADASTYANGSAAWYIGRHDTNATNFFNGSIPVLRMYDRALSDAEVRLNYIATADRYHTVLDFDFADKRTLFPTSTTVVRSMTNDGVSGTLNTTSHTTNYNGGLIFNGSNSYIDLPYALLTGTGDFTASFWIQTDADAPRGGGTLLANYNAGDFQVFHSRHYIGFYLGNYSAYLGTAPWTNILPQFTSTATNMTVLRRGTTTEVYLNGVLQRTGASSSSFGSTSNFRMGTNTVGTEQYKGKIFASRVLNRAYSAAEVDAYYQATRTRF